MIEKFSHPDNAHNSHESKEVKTEKEILILSLQYCEKLLKKEIPLPCEVKYEINFENLLRNFTDIQSEISDQFERRTGKIPAWKSHDELEDFEIDGLEFEKIEDEIFEAIENEREVNPNGWFSQVNEIIQNKINTLPSTNKENKNSEERQSSHEGLLKYNITENIPGLETVGISLQDECLLIHIDPLFKTKDKNITLSDSFLLLAKKIEAEYPNIKAVVAESWLVDSAFGKRIGFHEFPSRFENFYHGDAFWGQFYDQEGKLKKELIDEFLKTGKAPYKIKAGYFTREEFLKKYLTQ